MSSSLWPDITKALPPRGIIEMLYDAAGDISSQTNGVIEFYVDTIGVGRATPIQHVRYNCYLHVVKKNYMHLLFRVAAPVASSFPATAETPEGDKYADLNTEDELRNAIREILLRDRTKEVVLFLLKTVPRATGSVSE